MNIVLHEPGIALNTGNIGRTCAATLTSLHLIRPYGFRITEKEIKRAGMDYWEKIDLHEYIDFEDFLEKHQEITFNSASRLQAAPKSDYENVSAGSSAEAAAVQNTASEDASLRHSSDCTETDINVSCRGAGIDEAVSKPKLWFASTKARQSYTDVHFGQNDYIMLGNESRGIPEEILVQHPEACIRIPMWGDIRSLNLANSAAIILYEALRQNGFEHMERCGNLHRLSWNSSASSEQH